MAGCVSISVTGVDCDSVSVNIAADPLYTKVECAGQTKEENKSEDDTLDIDTPILDIHMDRG